MIKKLNIYFKKNIKKNLTIKNWRKDKIQLEDLKISLKNILNKIDITKKKPKKKIKYSLSKVHINNKKINKPSSFRIKNFNLKNKYKVEKIKTEQSKNNITQNLDNKYSKYFKLLKNIDIFDEKDKTKKINKNIKRKFKKRLGNINIKIERNNNFHISIVNNKSIITKQLNLPKVKLNLLKFLSFQKEKISKNKLLKNLSVNYNKSKNNIKFINANNINIDNLLKIKEKEFLSFSKFNSNNKKLLKLDTKTNKFFDNNLYKNDITSEEENNVIIKNLLDNKIKENLKNEKIEINKIIIEFFKEKNKISTIQFIYKIENEEFNGFKHGNLSNKQDFYYESIDIENNDKMINIFILYKTQIEFISISTILDKNYQFGELRYLEADKYLNKEFNFMNNNCFLQSYYENNELKLIKIN